MFKVHENGKTYQVEVRGSFQHSIRSERKLREALSKAIDACYGAGQANGRGLFDMDRAIGIISTSRPIE
jgi:hypothetical protein